MDTGVATHAIVRVVTITQAAVLALGIHTAFIAGQKQNASLSIELDPFVGSLTDKSIARTKKSGVSSPQQK